jgi:hypothetical protein
MNASKTGSIFAMMFVIGSVYADNEIYIDQVGDSSVIEIIQDGSGNKVGGSTSDDTKFLLSGDNMDFNANISGGTNNLIGSIIGTSTVDIDVSGASGGNFVFDLTGSNNELDLDVGSLDTANDLDFDMIVDGDFNAADINIDASSLTFNMDMLGDNNNLIYNGSGYDGHEFVLTGNGSYWDIEISQESTLQTDSLEIDYEGSGTSTTDATICIIQSDSGTATVCSP